MSGPILNVEIEVLAQAVAKHLANFKRPVLTLAEAIEYVGHESASAFYRWTAKWRVTACAQGRYARGHLDRALQREAATRGTTKRAA